MAVVTNYTGDAGLASGSNPQIPLTDGRNLDVINQTANQIMLQRAAFNKNMFDQRVRDRDNLIKAIDDGQIKVGNILEQDDSTVKKALEGIDAAYGDMMKNGGLGNLDALRKYRNAVREAQSTVTQAQTRFLDVTGARNGLAKETNPVKRARLQKNLDEYSKKGFWADYTPPQEFQDLSMDRVLKMAVPIASEYSDPTNPLKKIKESRYSYDPILKKANEEFLDDEGRENQRILLEQLQSLDPATTKQTLDAYNQQLKLYSAQTGDKPLEIKYQQFPDGTIAISEKLPELAAKVSLASVPKYVTRSSDVDKGELELEKLREQQRAAKADEAIKWYNAKTNRMSEGRLAKAAGVSDQVATGAIEYAEGLAVKLKSLADKNGVIKGEQLASLTKDELKYLGNATTEENKFTLAPVDITDKVLKIDSDGNIQIGSYTSGMFGKSKFEPEYTIEKKTVALNKLGDEMMQTTGKEGYNFNSLIPLYKNETETVVETPKGETVTVKKEQSNSGGYSNVTTVTDKNGNPIQAGVKDGKWYDIKTGKELK